MKNKVLIFLAIMGLLAYCIVLYAFFTSRNTPEESLSYLGVEVVSHTEDGVIFGTVDSDETVLVEYKTTNPEKYVDDAPYLLSMYGEEIAVVWKVVG